ncbi:MAG: ABC transporter permease, partial [Bacillota bacterium]
VSLLTVMLSAWLPARKAALIPAIDAIRLTQEIKVRKGKLRTSRLVRALFGFEGTLAAKAIKRSRRSYRAMVAALAISIVLYLVCASLDTQITMTMNQAYNNISANTYTTLYLNQTGAQSERRALDIPAVEQATDTMRAYPDTTLYGVGIDNRFTLSVQNPDLTDTLLNTLEPEQAYIHAVLATPDRAHYEALCAAAGVPVGSNILINSAQRVIQGKTTEFQPLRFYGQTLVLEDGDTRMELPLHTQLSGTQVPQEIVFAADEAVIVVVPDCEVRLYCWFGLSADPAGFIAHAESTLQTFFPAASGTREGYAYTVTDVSAVTEMTRSLTRLITVFLYGFVGMLSLIGLTSVISAISANVQLRAREFAVLASVGMTQGGIRRMLALESVMSALKALLWGLPLGVIGMYLSYLALTRNVKFGFVFPWFTVPEVVLGVFVITLITTQYAAAKLRGGSLMDIIRANEGI